MRHRSFAGALALLGWLASVSATQAPAAGSGPAPERAVPLRALLERLDAEDPLVRAKTARALGRIGPPAIAALRAELRSHPETGPSAALGALRVAAREHGSAAAEAAPVFLARLFKGPPASRERAAEALVDLRIDPTVIGARVRALLHASDIDLPEELHHAADIPDDGCGPLLETLDRYLDDADACRRLLAATVLARSGRHGLPVLVRALRDGGARKRTAAAWALALGDARWVVPALLQSYGVSVETRVTHRFFPRELWPCANARPIDGAAARAALGLVARALARYPNGLVRRHLESVRLAADLRVAGLAYGGTFYASTVFLAAGAAPAGALTRAFHHEFSSLLLAANAFPAEEWRAANPDGFTYGGGGREAIRAGSVGRGDDALFAEGFFAPYARADLENDVNVFSETVLGEPEWARKLIARHPRLAAKWRVWIRYYHGLDPSFTEAGVLGP